LLICLELVGAEKPEFYRVAAAQLRLLLCDTTRRHGQVADISLARRLWPDLRLPTLGAKIETVETDLPLIEWLAQPVPGGITLRRLIRLVCDQDGGAHVDPHPDAGLPEGLDVPYWIGQAAQAAQAAVSGLEKYLVER
jgi:hypothetical protein